MKKKYFLHHLDTCTGDYFRGYHNDVVQVIIDGEITYQDIKDMLLDVSWSTEHIEDLDDDAYKLAVEVLFEGVEDMTVVFDNSIEVCPEDDFDLWESWETCYIFFGLDTVDEDEDDV